jgi:CSLREA domain-containing protein
MRGKQRFLTGLIGACLMMVSPAICRAQTTITVTSLADPSDSGLCTLRDAINGALTSMSPDCATSGSGAPYTITFSAGLAGGTITLGSALPTITSPTDLTITGPTTSSAGIAIDGGHMVRLMQVNSGATLNLQYVTLQNGSVTGAPHVSVSGGAIANEGTLTIANSTLSGNYATGGVSSSVTDVVPVTGSGGAIANDGTLTIANSTFSANQAAGGGGDGYAYGYGGAIANDGTVTITNSTFSANQAMGDTGGAIYSDSSVTITSSTFSGNQADDYGGAIDNDGGTATITSSTFSGNQAGYYGGAIFSQGGTATITSSTLSGNSVPYEGGGIYNYFGQVSIKGTILANESLGDNCAGDALTDDGYNISDDSTCGFSATGSAINVDPMLAALADNGGPTMTFALESGSPAIDAIPLADCTDQASPTPNPITTDQRGMSRPDAGEAVCDIGAYEFQEKFVGTPGATNCNGKSASALSNQYGTLDAAAAALGYPSVKALQTDIKAYCAG